MAMMTAAAVILLGMSTVSRADCRKKVALTGASADVSGVVDARASGERQRFRLSMDANVPDGTTFTVWANGELIGTITMQLGAGELDLNNNNGKVLPAAARQACSVTTVTVLGSGGLVLQGNF
jgi:hypothetical protein